MSRGRHPNLGPQFQSSLPMWANYHYSNTREDASPLRSDPQRMRVCLNWLENTRAVTHILTIKDLCVRAHELMRVGVTHVSA